MNLIEKIREGQIISNGHANHDEMYRGVFVGKNFFLYKYVNKGLGYRGNTYPVEGYVLAWTDCSEFGELPPLPPSFVPLRD